MFGQAKAKKPTLMVMPSEAWCYNNGYMMEYDNQGTAELSPNYKLALQTHSEVNQVISKIGELMTERGFPLVDLSASIRSLEQEQAINRAMTSKSGASIVESPVDMLKRQAKADITLELDYTVNQSGPKKTVSYNLRALDAYTNKQVAASSNVGAPSFSADVPTLLQEAVLSNMDNFTSQLQTHFDDLFDNGREVTVRIQVFENPENIDLETEFGDRELNEIINDWMYENTVQHRYSEQNSSENFIVFDQVRIPIFDERGRPMDTKSFAQGLQKHLKAAPCNITSKVDQRGLGQCYLISVRKPITLYYTEEYLEAVSMNIFAVRLGISI
jgi:hypothetical protein